MRLSGPRGNGMFLGSSQGYDRFINLIVQPLCQRPTQAMVARNRRAYGTYVGARPSQPADYDPGRRRVRHNDALTVNSFFCDYLPSSCSSIDRGYFWNVLLVLDPFFVLVLDPFPVLVSSVLIYVAIVACTVSRRYQCTIHSVNQHGRIKMTMECMRCICIT